MAWFRNYYHCSNCGTDWQDEWSCCCDDECPSCGSRNWAPYSNDDLTFIIERDAAGVAVYESPISAEYYPDYALIAIAPTEGAANSYIKWRLASYWAASP